MNINLVERLENLLAAIEQAGQAVLDSDLVPVDETRILARIDDADGIAREVLTLIDGR